MPKKEVTEKEDKKEEEKNKKVVVVEEVDETTDTPSFLEEREESVEESPKKNEEESPQQENEKDEEEAEEEKKSTDSDSDTDEKPKTGKLLWIIIPTTLLVGALAGGVITYFSGLDQLGAEPTPVPQATVSPSNSPTPTPKTESDLKREDLKIQVLNGSGVSGSAGKAADFLEGLGYVDVAAGNADSADYETTQISIKKESEDYLDLITSDLEEEYTLSTKTETLAASSSYDVVITLGAK